MRAPAHGHEVYKSYSSTFCADGSRGEKERVAGREKLARKRRETSGMEAWLTQQRQITLMSSLRVFFQAGGLFLERARC